MTVEPKFLIHQATHLFMTEPIHFQVTQMDKSAIIWIGNSEGRFGDMSAAVPPFGSQVRIKFIECTRNSLLFYVDHGFCNCSFW
jgi:hypothetical protein